MTKEVKRVAFIGNPDDMGEEERWLLKQLIMAYHADKIDLSIVRPLNASDDFPEKINALIEQLSTEGMTDYVFGNQEEPFDLQSAFSLYSERNLTDRSPLGPLSVRLVLPDIEEKDEDAEFDKDVWKSSKLGRDALRILEAFVLGIVPKALAERTAADDSMKTISEVTIRSHYERYSKEVFCEPNGPQIFFGTVRKYAVFGDDAIDRLAKLIYTNTPTRKELDSNKFFSESKAKFWKNFVDIVKGCERHMGHLEFRKTFDAYSPLIAIKYFLKSKLRVLDEVIQASYDEKPRNLKLYDEEALNYAMNDEKALAEIRQRLNCKHCSKGMPRGELERFWIFILNYLALFRVKDDPKLAILVCRVLPVFVLEEIELSAIYLWLQKGQESGLLAINPDKQALIDDLQIVEDAKRELFTVAKSRLAGRQALR